MAEKQDHVRLTGIERAAIRETLEDLTPEQWATRSLCEAWTVRELAGHLASADDTSIPRFLATVLASGFSTHKASQAFIARWTARPQEELLAAIANPQLKGIFKLMPAGALTEAFLHGQDIRRPLGLTRSFSEECLRAVGDASCTAATGTGSKKRAAGLRLRATDVEWTRGDGPEVTGTAEALIMSLNGRRVALDELDGPGREILAGR